MNNRFLRRAAVAVPAAGAALALAAPAFAAPAWVITPIASPADGLLNAVSARTGADAWAVGTFPGPNDDDGGVMLAEHWNGTAWSQTPTPNIFRFDEKLNAVSAASAGDVWAVGSQNMTGFKHTDPIAAHFDGATWTIVPTPATTGGSKSILFGVAALAGADAWAVGRSEGNRALIEHWNGTAWTIVPAPVPSVPAGETFVGTTLNAISARSATDIWAVGLTQSGKGTASNSYTLTMHYNGTSWTIVPSPNPAVRSPLNGVQQSLNGVVEISPNDAWAVGNTVDTVSGAFQPNGPIAMHWNGTAWSLARVPTGVTTRLSAVSANSSGTVWADGDGTILRFNGARWATETVPGLPILKGIASVPGTATEAFAAGSAVGPYVAHHQ
jgi:hypothetical protein